jgi:hypothetical protein
MKASNPYTGSIMKNSGLAPWLVAGFLAVVPMFGAAPRAQQPAAPPAPDPAAPAAPNPTFRTSVNLVSSDVIVRNRRGQFQADLTKDDFEVYEDGVKQDLTSFTLVHGGRVYQTQAATVAPVREGIVCGSFSATWRKSSCMTAICSASCRPARRRSRSI